MNALTTRGRQSLEKEIREVEAKRMEASLAEHSPFLTHVSIRSPHA